MKEKKVGCELGVPLCHLIKGGKREETDKERLHCGSINAAVLQSHHTTFRVFDVKGSGVGHMIINGNLRERVAA